MHHPMHLYNSVAIQLQHEGAVMTQVLCDACLFDANTLTWKLKEPTPFARCAHTAVALPSGEPPAAVFGTLIQCQVAVVCDFSVLHIVAGV